jgi:hypothetical protein
LRTIEDVWYINGYLLVMVVTSQYSHTSFSVDYHLQSGFSGVDILRLALISGVDKHVDVVKEVDACT